MTTTASGSIILLGASYAAGWTLPPIDGRTVINKGVGGQQTFQLAERFDADVTAARPEAVIIWGHINDIFNAPEGGADAAVTRARASLQQMVAKAQAAGIQPILATEVTIGGAGGWSDTLSAWTAWLRGSSPYQDYVNRHVMAVNAWLRELASRERLTLLDLHGALADPSGRRRPQFSQPDGSHITARGYEALTAYAVPVLEAHFRSAR